MFFVLSNRGRACTVFSIISSSSLPPLFALNDVSVLDATRSTQFHSFSIIEMNKHELLLIILEYYNTASCTINLFRQNRYRRDQITYPNTPHGWRPLPSAERIVANATSMRTEPKPSNKRERERTLPDLSPHQTAYRHPKNTFLTLVSNE